MPAFALDPRYAEADRISLNRADRIRALNDSFRRNPSGGKVVVTPGVADLPLAEQCRLFIAVRNFDAFTPDNDPYEEHDFAALEQDGERYLWKIDYYDLELAQGAADPSDHAFTIRVLTIMRADE